MSEELVAFGNTDTTPNIRFLVSLSDGRTIVEDARPGEARPWMRVRKFLKESGLHITELRVQNKDFQVVKGTPPNQKGYFYGEKIIGIWPGGANARFVGIGYYDGDKVHVKWYVKPHLAQMEPDVRTVESCNEMLFINE